MARKKKIIESEAENRVLELTVPLLPLKNTVFLPKSIIPVIVGRPSSIQAVEYALKSNKMLFVTAQKDVDVESPSLYDVYVHGTTATILQVMAMPNGSLKILIEGISRAKIVRPTQPAEAEFEGKFLYVEAQVLPNTGTENLIELEAIFRQLKDIYVTYTTFNEKAPSDLAMAARSVEDIDYITDTIAMHVNLTLDERQMILELVDLKERMLTLIKFLNKEIDILQTEQRIKGRIQTQVDQSQREYYLTEQMKAIQKELGREDQSTEITQLRAKAKTLGLSADALEKVEKELRRLEQMPPLSSEAAVSRNYIDWTLSIPWKEKSKDTISLTQAEKILNSAHAGLKKAKERIIEFLAAKKFSKTLERSPIICLAGPPGVGKTSLAHSIAQSLGREFVRISLGGVKDEAEIRGHRRTYIGSMPGKIIQAMKKAKTINPVILLDEIDKMSRDFHGDPAAALLEVLDPEQNKTFVDHYLDTEYDLSKVMFITTANMLEGIPLPLYDRMEIISLSGYTEDEKVTIAKKFLIPKNLTEYNLTPQSFVISDEIIHTVVSQYTREAGVRQLERVITKLMRKAIQVLLKDKKQHKVVINAEYIQEWLGYPKFKKTSLDVGSNRIGLATGLAWTEVGGDVLEIETSIIPGKGGMTLTGQLGEVMQESAQAALSYIRSRAAELGLKPSFYTSQDIHLHIPEGATPKDGPSAGITICCALISALTNKPLKPHLAMTGEITLRGRVLSIGGLKEKLLAAKQHAITTAIVPHENEDDVKDILKEIDLSGVKIIFVKTMDEVLPAAFEDATFKALKTNAISSKKKSAKKKQSKKQ